MSRPTAFSRCADWLWRTRDGVTGRTLQIMDSARLHAGAGGRSGALGRAALPGAAGGGRIGRLGSAPNVRRSLTRSREEEMEEEAKASAAVDRRHANVLIMSGGKAHVPDSLLAAFRQIYAWDVRNGVTLSMCEVEPSLDTVRRMKYDVDHKRLDRFVTLREIAVIVRNLHKVQHMFLPQGKLRGVLMQREHCAIVKDGRRIYTSGQHVVWSRGTLSGHKCRRVWASAAYVLQKQCGHMLEHYVPGHDTFETVLDPGVYVGGLRAPYSVKYQPCGACNDVNRDGCFRCKGAGKFNLGREYKPTHEITEDGELRAFTQAELDDIGAMVERCSVRVAGGVERSDYTVDECQPYFPEALDEPANVRRRQLEEHAFRIAEEEAVYLQQQQEPVEPPGATATGSGGGGGGKRKSSGSVVSPEDDSGGGGGGGGGAGNGREPPPKKSRPDASDPEQRLTKLELEPRASATRSGGGGGGGERVSKGGPGAGGDGDSAAAATAAAAKWQMLERYRRQRAALSEKGAPKLPANWICYDASAPQYAAISRFIRTALAPEYRDARCSSLASTPTGTKYVMHTRSSYCQNLGGEHNRRTVYFVFDSQNRTCRQRCTCRCPTSEGRQRGRCKEYSSDEVGLPLDMARLLFGTRGERSVATKQKKLEANQRFKSEMSGKVATAGDTVLAHIRKSNGGKIPSIPVLSRRLIEHEPVRTTTKKTLGRVPK